MTNEPDYVKYYEDYMNLFLSASRAVRAVFDYLARNMDSKTNHIIADRYVKEQMSKEINVSVSRISSVLAKLNRANCIIRIQNSRYVVNPHLARRNNHYIDTGKYTNKFEPLYVEKEHEAEA